MGVPGMPGVPGRVDLRLRVIAYIEAMIFFGLLLAAAAIQPVWLAATLFVVGMFGSGFAWLLILQHLGGHRPQTAHEVPKG
jgi:hypothetical protein